MRGNEVAAAEVRTRQAAGTYRDPWSVSQRRQLRESAERWSLSQQALFAAVRTGSPAAELDETLARIKVEHRMRRDARAVAELARELSHRLDIEPNRVLLVADLVRDALRALECAA